MSVRPASAATVLWASLVAALAGATPTPVADDAQLLLVVDCLLPGQIRQLGQRTTYVSARRPARTTARDCQIRGGEYTAHDRADLGSALAVWLPAAERGDAEAATIVGEIFERGVRATPDFTAAATWYARAAELGSTRAQINLGHLHERGLGVPRDPARAVFWYRRAAGQDGVIALDQPPPAVALAADPAQERLRAETDELRLESEQLRAQSGQLRSQSVRLSSQLAQTQAELTRARAELEQADAATAARAAQLQQSGAALEEQRRVADQGREELARLQAALEQREALAAEQSAEAERLRVALQTVQSSAAEQSEQLARLRAASTQAVAVAATPAPAPVDPQLVAGPEISIIEPQLLATRDIAAVSPSATALAMSGVAAGAPRAHREVIGRVVAPAGLLRLVVNDEIVSPNEQGVFIARIDSGAAPVVRVVAIDRNGKRAAVEVPLPGEGSTAAAQPATRANEELAGIDFGRYHALLIGNNEYAHLRDLHSAIEDATQLAQVLERRYGFQTRVLNNASRYAILAALNDLREKLTSEDNLLIYYAGHGELDAVNQRGYWLPVDAEPGSNANWIPSFAVTDILNIMQARQILLVVDSCYAGALTRSSVGRLVTGTTLQERRHWLRALSKKRARTVLTSGGLAPVLDTGGGKHSVFARALLEVLNGNEGLLEGQRLHREVAARVSYAAGGIGFDQVPEYAPIRFAGHEAGEFFLVPRP